MLRMKELDFFGSPQERRCAGKDAFRAMYRMWRFWLLFALACVPAIVGLSSYLLTGESSLLASGVAAVVIAPAYFPMRRLMRHEFQRQLAIRCICLGCGYDLIGNESGVCPECGTEIEVE